jgi:hypothetical protein
MWNKYRFSLKLTRLDRKKKDSELINYFLKTFASFRLLNLRGDLKQTTTR